MSLLQEEPGKKQCAAGKPSLQLLAVERLAVTYRGGQKEVPALKDVSLSLGKGETLGMIGESGSGKTTFALALLGLINSPHQVSGSVFFDGQDFLALPEEQKKKLRWRRLSLVFQNSQEVFNPVMKIGQQVGEPLQRHFGLTGEATVRQVVELFFQVGLDPLWTEAYPHQLSGGMRQRALIAMALSCRPELLIIDEPTTSLDAVSRKEILELLECLQRELGFSMLVISHDLSVISRLTDNLIVLYGGEVMESGVTREILEEPRHSYTRGLIHSSVEVFPYKDLWGIPGEPAGADHLTACAFVNRCTQGEKKCLEIKPPLSEPFPGRLVRCHLGGIRSVLTAQNLNKEFQLSGKRIPAVKDVSLHVHHGETVALVGASGAGKSTLAQILAGFLSPDEGEVIFRGDRITGSGASRREGGIQLVLQDPFAAISHRLTVGDAVAEPLNINKISFPEERQERVKEALSAVQLPTGEEFLGRFCYTLSGGQRQRLSMARALVMKPALLLADEITSMLDVSTQANLMRLLKGLQNSRGFAMLYITHDLHLARKVAERIIVLQHGRVVEEGAAFRIMEESCCCHTHTREMLEAGLFQTG